MSWREAILSDLPPTRGDEPGDVRRDILDEIEDHLECAMRREFLREQGIDESTARRNVLKRFGDPAAIARKLWFDAMKGTLMNQRILIGTNILLVLLVLAMFIVTFVMMRQNQHFQESLVNRLAVIPAAPSEAQPDGDATAMSWPSARIRVEGGNAPFRLQLQGEPYNPGEKIMLHREVDSEDAVFGPMRPGGYTLHVTDAHGARSTRSVIVPPGGEHLTTVEAPDWQPKPTPVRIRFELPENIHEKLGVIAVFEGLTSSVEVNDREVSWNKEKVNLVVHADGRVARLDERPFSQSVAITRSFSIVRNVSTYSVNTEAMGLENEVTLDASLYYVTPDRVNFLVPVPADDGSGIVYHRIDERQTVSIQPQEIASGEVRLPLALSEAAIERMQTAVGLLRDACTSVGATRALDRENMCYVLHPATIRSRTRPEQGYGLLIVLPGGDGSAEFRNFVGTIQSQALRNHLFLLAQAIAPVWSPDQAEQVVWPTRGSPWPNMQFTTEEFIDAIIEDVSSRLPVNPQRIYALAWSSSGPALYAAMLQEETKLRGAFIAMSVFHPDQYPPAENAAGRSFYLLHSPQDFIQMRFPNLARDTLAAAGANVHLQTYQGGHGWHGDVHGMIRGGIEWLESQAAPGSEEPTIGTSP